MDELIEIEKVITNSKLPLLLGNGFSINIYNEFNYSTLIELIYKKVSPKILDLLNDSKELNLEDVLNKLETFKNVSNSLKLKGENVQPFINELKRTFISVISDIQPPLDFYKEKFDSDCSTNETLQKFSYIFTTNYDLSLYYLTIESKNFIDRFGYVHFPKNTILTFHPENHHHKSKIPLLYLHGNLIFFKDDVDQIYTSKLKSIPGSPILEQIKKNIDSEKFPIIITEGDSKIKLRKILSNDYLNYCWNLFGKTQNKELVVYGHSLSDSDEHIIKLIDKYYNKIYFGIHENTLKNQSIIKSKFDNVEVKFFDSSKLFN